MHLVYPADEWGNEQKLPGQEPGIRVEKPFLAFTSWQHLTPSFPPSMVDTQQYIETMFIILLEGTH